MRVHFSNQMKPSSQMSDSTDKTEGIMLRVNPEDTITFSKSENELVGNVQLKNICNSLITYKVKTTSPEKFRVRPSTGILSPGISTSIQVLLYEGQHVNALNKDKFLVMAMELNSDPNISSQEIADLWKQTSSQSTQVEQHRLKCVDVAFNKSDISRNGSKIVGSDSESDKQIAQIKFSISKLTENCSRLESQMRFNQIVQCITLFVLLLLFAALLYTLKYEIRKSNNNYCTRPN